MATLNIVNYNLLTDLIMKVNNDDQSNSTGAITNTGSNTLSKTFNKITVQNILSESSGSVLNVANSNNPNAIVRKIKDFGMIGSVNNAASITLSVISSRKRPLQENKLQHNAANKEKRAESSNPSSNTATGKKTKLTKEERAALRAARKAAKENSLALTKLQKSATDFKCIVKQPGTPGRKALPLPQAVARRNARERNRVKQVNNGFAALRERIPDELAESFEAQYSNSRGSGKKLSKVETLRMAVEYIRGLERLLGFDFSNENEVHRSASSGEDSFILIKDEFDVLSPLPHEPLDDSFNQSLVHVQNAANTDIYPDVTTLNGLQYMRIPGTNTYQLISPDIYASGLNSPTSSSLDDEPHLYTNLIDAHCLSPPETIAPVSTADLLHSSSALINVPHIINGTNAITTAPAIIAAAPAIRNGSKCVNEGTSPSELNLLKSPVPQTQPAAISAASSTSLSTTATSLSSSPTPSANTTSSSLHQPITTPPATTTTIITATQPSELSPAAANEQLDLRQTCASNQQLLQQQTTIFTEPNSTYLKSFIQQYKDNSKDDVNLIYQTCINSQQQQQQQQQQQVIRELQTQEQQLFVNSNAFSVPTSLDNPPVSINTSPVNLTTCSPAHLSTFYDHHASENPQSFFTEVVTLKKDFDDTLLESTHSNPVLSDESLIESIDWWETQTHKSDGTALL